MISRKQLQLLWFPRLTECCQLKVRRGHSIGRCDGEKKWCRGNQGNEWSRIMGTSNLHAIISIHLSMKPFYSDLIDPTRRSFLAMTFKKFIGFSSRKSRNTMCIVSHDRNHSR